MGKLNLDGLSEAELELLGEYLTHTGEIYMKTVAQVLTTEEFGTDNAFGAGLADVLHHLSDDVTAIDRQVLRLNNMRESLQRIAATSPEREMPDGAEITPEKLHWLAIRSELTSYYSQVGVLLEEFSTELIFQKIVDEERRSNSIRQDIERKSQWEREWLLFVTGIIDSGEKDNLRKVYRRRNKLVHSSTTEASVDSTAELREDIEHAWDTVDFLHEKLFGLEMKHRISEIALGNGF